MILVTITPMIVASGQNDALIVAMDSAVVVRW